MSFAMLEPGERFGDFRVVRKLGAGGMGAVYLVEDDESGCRYAAKILFPESEVKDHDDAVGRFVREAEISMSIDHPNLVRVYDVGRDPETKLGYMIMEYLPGGSLHDRIARRLEREQKPLGVKEAVAIVRDLTFALEAIEKKGVVHRDIKPENILFDEQGVSKLSDLGIAKSASSEQLSLTMSNMIVGTPGYMAPEQLMDSKHADIRCDIYSLGVVLWEMLAGFPPHAEMPSSEIMLRAVRKVRIADIRTVRPKTPRRIVQLLRKMTAPKVVARFQHPSEIVRFLDDYAARERLFFRLFLAGALAFAVVAIALSFVFIRNWAAVSDGASWADDYPEGLLSVVETNLTETVREIEPVREVEVVPVCEEAVVPEAERAPVGPDEKAERRPVVAAASTASVSRADSLVRTEPVQAKAVGEPPVQEHQISGEKGEPSLSELVEEFSGLQRAESAAQIRDAVNAARQIDAEFSRYDWDGVSAEGEVLPKGELSVLRRGRVFFLCWKLQVKEGRVPTADAVSRVLMSGARKSR